MENERASQARSGARGRSLEALTPLVLASASPRRAEILRAGGWPLEAAPARVDETRRGGGGLARRDRRRARQGRGLRRTGARGTLHRRHRGRLLERRRPARAASLRDGAAGDGRMKDEGGRMKEGGLAFLHPSSFILHPLAR